MDDNIYNDDFKTDAALQEGESCCCDRRKTVRSEEDKHAFQSRLNRIAGQINGVKRMVEEDRYCDDILIQLSAIDKAVKSLANLLLDKHMHSCLIKRIKEGELDAIDEIVELFKRFQ